MTKRSLGRLVLAGIMSVGLVFSNVFLVSVPQARAAFPGRNGKIAFASRPTLTSN